MPTRAQILRDPLALGRRELRFPNDGVIGASSVSDPTELLTGATLWYEPSGLSASAWDSIGTNTLQFNDGGNATRRPTISTIGSVDTADFDGATDYFTSASTFQIVAPFVLAVVLRVDAVTANAYVLDFSAGGAAGRLRQGPGTNDLQWGVPGGNLIGGTVGPGVWKQLIVVGTSSLSGVTHKLYENGALIDDNPSTSGGYFATSCVIGGRVGGSQLSNVTVADFAIWNSVGDENPDVSGVIDWQDDVVSRLGVTPS